MVIAIALTAGCESRENGTVVTEEKIEEEKVEVEKVSKETKVTDSKQKMVKLETSLGDIVIELDKAAAPVTVKNFLGYVEGGFFDGTIFHRVINGFMIQGGGFTANMGQKQTRPSIVNEASNGLKNDRGTIAMARTNNPDSATSQFFINHKENDFLNYVEGRNPGYAVFGRTVEGMDVVDKIAAVKTTVRSGMRDVPVETVLIKSAKLVSEK
jgi:peptidyl-prolyl cis-trans isomerase A (cyclophilin A)